MLLGLLSPTLPALALVFNDVPGIQSFYGYKLPFEEKGLRYGYRNPCS
jgi:hypothetical protein